METRLIVDSSARMANRSPTVRIGLVIPLQGPAGIFGPSSEACAQLAAEELNLGGGVLGREVELVIVDGGQTPNRVADEVDALVSAGAIDAVVGWHLSSVRQALIPRIAGRVPYVYTALYEGGERAPGVFLAGETPIHQVLPAMQWLAREHRLRRWAIVGDSYIWPYGTARAARRHLRLTGAEICAEIFVPLGTRDFHRPIRQLIRTQPDAVLMLLVGNDAVRFNRAFTRAGLHTTCLRFAPLMDENMLLASGADTTANLYVAAGYFATLPTTDNLDFHALYTRRFGPHAPPLNAEGESCYEGIILLAELIARAGTLNPTDLMRVADTTGYDGPRGPVRLHDRHLHQRIYLAKANQLEFDVITKLQEPPPT